MKIVEASFIKDKKQDQNTGSHAYGKASYIDERINFILPQIAPGGDEIVFDHNFHFMSNQ
jgi:hypothetical protein